MPSTSCLRTRREFLRSTVLGGALSWTVPTFLAETFNALQAAAAEAATQPVTGKDARILVVLQLAGGNDGLNTVVPFADDNYYRARPKLGINTNDVLRLTDDTGLHPSLTGLQRLFGAGHLGVVQGVGYPNPNRSHFRSTEIWQTATAADRVAKYGWLGRYFDNTCPGADPAVGISIGQQMPQAFAAAKPLGVCIQSVERYRAFMADRREPGHATTADDFYHLLNEPEEGKEMGGNGGDDAGATVGAIAGHPAPAGSPLDFLERVALDAQVSSDRIRTLSQRVQNQATYPAGQLANNLKLIARLIGGGMATRVYYLSQGGYDTHTNQIPTHQRLLAELGGALQSFVEDLKAQGNFERVLVMTFSEFGRRLAENANTGTDHGAAAPMFIVAPKLQAGLLGRAPNLAPADLFNGDPEFTTDFRSVYAGVLEDWMHTASAPILGRQFDPLRFV